MRTFGSILLLVIVLAGLTRCWSQMELVDRAFVQAAALDRTPDGGIQLTAQIYKPGSDQQSSEHGKLGASTYVSIITRNLTVLGAVRDANNELGRKLQLSHMSSLLISEDIAKSRILGHLLDFFSRDHEPRGTLSVIITKGQAKKYLQIQPMIETTMGQQLKEIEIKSFAFAGKTLETTVTDLDIIAKSPVPIAPVPYFILRQEARKVASASGLAIVNYLDGKMSGLIPARHTPYALMLMNRYKGGVINLPCEEAANRSYKIGDSFEVRSLHTRIRPVVRQDALEMKVSVSIEGSIGELSCRRVITEQETRTFLSRISTHMHDRLRETLLLLQREKADIIGVGNSLYRTRNRLWKVWEPDWPNRFAESDFSIDVKAKLLNTGIQAGKSDASDG
ncbi:Ger(x)C family spore germination protein [Paenibacillaceae bacterium WGS1546]|uniref:Ger(x)C family spore germination protein n=1 Tax=Cohnella sp. WGS1546 TaxID=3366810 RepID=UPI00372D2756